MNAIIIFVGFIAVCALLSWISMKLTRNMREDYEYMLSQRESRDNRQSISDKVNTSIGGNDLVDCMVNVSMLNQNDDE